MDRVISPASAPRPDPADMATRGRIGGYSKSSKYAADRADMASRGRLGGFAKASKYPAAALTQAARDGFMAKLAAQVDAEAEGPLDPIERDRRIEAKRRLFYARIARARWKKRRHRSGAQEPAE